MHRNPNLRADTMQLLQDVLFTSHHYTRVYQQAYKILGHMEIEDLAVRLIADPSQDQRRYNLPTAREVAVIVPGDENHVPDSRDVILRRRCGQME